MYWMNLFESLSQVLNAIHAGNPNQTFSARVAEKRDTGNLGYPSFYWYIVIHLFESLWPGHLDWAKGQD